MSASIWTPGTSIPAAGTSVTRAVESVTVPAGQTVVPFTSLEYTPGTNSLYIFINGFFFSDYVETNSSSITLDSAFLVAVELVAVAGIPLNNGLGGDAVSFVAAGTNSDARTMQEKVREVGSMSVVDKGAEQDVDCSTELQQAVTDSTEIEFPGGSWIAATAPTYTGSRLFKARPGAVLVGAGLSALGLYSGSSGIVQSAHMNAGATDAASHYFRRQATYSGGTPGFVNAAVRADTFVTEPTAAAYEWAVVGVVYNYATAGQNVGGYFQGLKYSTGPTWGATVEVKEMAGTANPTTGTVALEVDVRANGTDTNTQRVGIDLVIGKHDSGGTAVTVSYGYRLQDAEALGTNTCTTGFSTFNMPCVVGFDTSAGTITQAAFKMASGQAIAFNAGATRKLYHDGSGLRFADSSNTIIGRITDTGAFQSAGGVQVLGNRIPGWTAASGTATRTTFDTATVTVAQLAERVKALIDDSLIHGFIGA